MADVSSTKAGIEVFVYSLYGLTRDETAIVGERVETKILSRETAGDSRC